MTPPTDEKASAMPSEEECDDVAERVLERLPTLAGGRDFNRALIRAGVEWAQAQRAEAVEVLKELVACKELKDRREAIVAAEDCNIVDNTRYEEWKRLCNEYNARKEGLWDRARALASHTKEGKE